jgi:hypothetical protein
MNATASIQQALRGFEDSASKGTCKECGKAFGLQPKRKFCSPKCRAAFFNRKSQDELRTRRNQIQNVDLPSLRLSPKDAKAVELYTKKVLGVRSIASLQGRSPSNVKRGLIRAGVYRPNPKHNGTAKTGMGPFSRILQREKAEQRERAWRYKMAVCLRGLRHGIPVEATCHSKAWTAASVWNHLLKNRAYQRWKKLHPSKIGNVLNYQRRQRFSWRSKKYSNESAFQDAIMLILKEFPFAYSREKKLTHSRSRADFEVGEKLLLECKISTASVSFFRAIGQAIHYQLHERKEVCIVLPARCFSSQRSTRNLGTSAHRRRV